MGKKEPVPANVSGSRTRVEFGYDLPPRYTKDAFNPKRETCASSRGDGFFINERRGSDVLQRGAGGVENNNLLVVTPPSSVTVIGRARSPATFTIVEPLFVSINTNLQPEVFLGVNSYTASYTRTSKMSRIGRR